MHDIILPTFGLQAHTAIMIYITAGLILFAFLTRGIYTLIPGKLQSMLELIVEAYIGLVEENVGHKGRKYVPFFLTFAIFIFVSTIVGLIPGLIPPTANLNSTVGLAIIVFLATHVIGFKEHGTKYIHHFIGPAWWLAPIMIPIEIVGHAARPLSLSLRLFGNMMGHEQIVMVLLVLMPAGYPLLALSTVLGIFVGLIQAFIFTLLSMLYIAGALEESH
jgi:F-type H+-transporting ATPase subunit a